MTLLRALCLLLGLLVAHPALAGELTIEVLDVGQGDGILITTPAGKRILIDAGTRKAAVLQQLRSRDVQQLDLVVATHAHADHIGGMEDVLRGLPVRFYTDNGLPHTTQTYDGVMKAVEELGITYRPAQRGQSFSLDDDARIEVLFPPAAPLSNTRSDLNSNSVVLRLTHGDNCFLFTGDSEDPTEVALMRAGIEPCGVLKVAHHGSEHSTSAAWLRAVQPDTALISAGVDNRYGHPDPEALGRLESAGITVYRTDLLGTLRVTSDRKAVTVEGMGKDQSAPTGAPTLAAAVGPESQHRGGALLSDAGAMGRALAERGNAGQASEAAPRQVAPALPAASAESSAGDAVSQAETAGDCAWVASRNSRLFHPAACHVVDRIYEANRVCFATVADAEASGRTRSASCPELGP